MILMGTIVNSDAPLVLRKEYESFPLWCERESWGYVVKNPLANFNLETVVGLRGGISVPEEEIEKIRKGAKFCDRIPDDFLMFPNVYYAEDCNAFRRCDRVWIRYDDRFSSAILDDMLRITEAGGLPLTFYAARCLFRKSYIRYARYTSWELDNLLWREEGREVEETLNMIADYILASTIVCGFFGPYKPSELGYVPQPSQDEDHEAYKNDTIWGYSIYAGGMALYEHWGNGTAFHVLTSHAYRPLEGGYLNGLTLLGLLNDICKQGDRERWGGLSEWRYGAACLLAYYIERGKMWFIDDYPKPFP